MLLPFSERFPLVGLKRVPPSDLQQHTPTPPSLFFFRNLPFRVGSFPYVSRRTFEASQSACSHALRSWTRRGALRGLGAGLQLAEDGPRRVLSEGASSRHPTTTRAVDGPQTISYRLARWLTTRAFRRVSACRPLRPLPPPHPFHPRSQPSNPTSLPSLPPFARRKTSHPIMSALFLPPTPPPTSTPSPSNSLRCTSRRDSLPLLALQLSAVTIAVSSSPSPVSASHAAEDGDLPYPTCDIKRVRFPCPVGEAERFAVRLPPPSSILNRKSSCPHADFCASFPRSQHTLPTLRQSTTGRRSSSLKKAGHASSPNEAQRGATPTLPRRTFLPIWRRT